MRQSDPGIQPKRVVVAMSGGVDSSAAALLLRDQGHEVVGVSMQVWDYRNHGGNSNRATCCAPADFNDARDVANSAGFPFYVFDFEGSFRESVIDPFINSYLKGTTPNPCIDCNRKVKFRELRTRAQLLGCSHVATGHYARIRAKNDGSWALFTAADAGKDQTYFLYALTQEELGTTLFPVGEMQKHQVRDYLGDRGVQSSQKRESQDICFISGTVAEFIEQETGKPTGGSIKNSSGDVLGSHDGIHQFTVGQRRGLRVSAADKLYVLRVDAESSDVIVGGKSELARESFTVADVNWIPRDRPQSYEALVKLRYRSPGVRCRLNFHDDSRTVTGEFLDEWTAVSPGQAAVFYQLEVEADGSREVLGGGMLAQ